MKTNILILFIAIASLTACKKSNVYNDNIVGTWEFRGQACFCAVPATPINTAPGNGNTIAFTETGYSRYSKGTLIKSGTYSTLKDNVSFPGTTANRIIYDNDTTQTNISKVFYKISNNKLTFYGTVSIAADGSEVYYERQ